MNLHSHSYSLELAPHSSYDKRRSPSLLICTILELGPGKIPAMPSEG